MNKQTLEIVTFRLKPDTSTDAFLASNESVNEFIAAQAGYIYRSLAQNPDNGMWTDVVYWQSLDAAKKAGELIMQTPGVKPFMDLIDMDSVTMSHSTIEWQTVCDAA